jgi:hypothetical protein
MELRRSENDGLSRLGALWKSTPGAELEAMMTGLDLTGWQDIIQYLRSLGMRENPQIVRLNICLSNDIRFTLEGAGVIQAFCRDNKIHNKPYTAMLKENIMDAVPVEFDSYAARAKLKREVPLAADDMRVKDALARWDQLAKLYRQIQRFEFVAPGGMALRFDVSLVREGRGRTYQESRITMAPAKYEAEVELTADRGATPDAAAAALVLKGLSWMLQGRQRSFVLVSKAGVEAVHSTLRGMFGGGGAGNRGGRRGGSNGTGRDSTFRYPGPQPATLERANMSKTPEPGIPNLIATPGGYNVTDKADGLRCMLYVAENGKIFLVDGGGRVYATGKQVPDKKLAGIALDGEWIQRNRRGEPVSHYYAFDILARAGGDTTVTGLPFLIAGEMLGSAASANTRQAALTEAVTALISSAQTVRGVPATANLQIGMKSFRAVAPGGNFYREAVAAVLDNARSAPYNTDGLIFTPNAAPLPLGQRSWAAQLKWKPPAENTIDFLVIVDKDRDAKGVPTAVDAIGTKYREDAGHTVRFKTLRLFVGSSRDGAYADPRTTILGGGALPASTEEGAWRPVEFRPTEPRDPMASICYIALGEGGADPAGATTAATALDTDSTIIRTTRTGDVIQSDMIVEMAYHPDRAPGWRWEPVRVRHDKTERLRGGATSGTMNADWVANSIWTTLHNPITEEAIRTGIVTECVAPPTIVAAAVAGGGRRAPARDLLKVQCMWNFHEDGIKRNMLLKPTLRPGSTLCDLGMGRARDIHKWIAEGTSYVFGCDLAAVNLNDPEDGAYRRLLDKMVSLGGRDRVPPMTFVQADMARRLTTGEAGLTPEDQAMLVREFSAGGPGAAGYDVGSCMFAIHTMFRDENTLAGFLTNLADTVKVGGYFVGCCMDGDAVAKMLYGQNSVTGRDGAADVWMMTKRFGSAIGSSVPPSAVGLGLAVDVDFLSIGETHTEYLVSWGYLQSMLATAGIELLTASECTELGLPASSQMFGETWAATGERWAMSDAMKRMSFLHRWFVFKRRSDARPAPPRGPIAATTAVTEVAPAVVEMPAAATGEGAGDAGEEEAGAAVEVAPTMDVIDLPEPVAAEAAPVNKQFVVSLAVTEPDLRLGEAYSDWPRYLTVGALSEIADLSNPAIKYPNIEAAVASAKYQRASNKPELGPTLFRAEGAIHQKYVTERQQLMARKESGELTEEEFKGLFEKTLKTEVDAIRLGSSKNKMRSFKADWKQDAWDAQKGEVYQAYLKQRYERVARFRAMIDAIRAKGGEILIENGTEYNEMGVGVRIDGSIVGGDNRIGKWMMGLGA